ncbi:MAG TPA: RHS repeat-associated core domain-containing protein, partial [Phycisphaerae bacterium]|nr:RHS repeat-associated core domain-containing protein [Phycisphaerae bacterium]HRR86272.1 RHS repeat-associated core domain-containing protein [Phycisphaerae bacterium]
THLGYWGYRYYSPRLGRWLSRDPIGEIAALNLYLAGDNALTNRYDPDGRACVGIGVVGSFTIQIPLILSGSFLGGGGQLSGSRSVYACTGAPHCRVCDAVTLTGLIGGGINISAGVGILVHVGGDPTNGLSFSVGGSVAGPGPAAGLTGEIAIDVDVTNGIVTLTIPRVSAGFSMAVAVRVSGTCTGCSSIFAFNGSAIRKAAIIACITRVVNGVSRALNSLSQTVVPAAYLPMSFAHNEGRSFSDWSSPPE